MGTANGGAVLSYINPATLTALSISSHLQSDVLSTMLSFPKCPFTLCQTSSPQQHQSHTRRKHVCMYVYIHKYIYDGGVGYEVHCKELMWEEAQLFLSLSLDFTVKPPIQENGNISLHLELFNLFKLNAPTQNNQCENR